MATVRKFVADRLKEDIVSQIKCGMLKSGDAILSGPQLSEKYGISKMSVDKAIREMVKAGILYRISGKGTFVTQSTRSLVIGMVANPEAKNIFTSHYHSHLYAGIEKAIAERKGILSYQKKEGSKFRQMFKDMSLIDGMIIINPEAKLEPELLDLAGTGLPFIVIGNSFPDPAINFVDSDNVADSMDGVESLIRSGSRKIAFITSMTESITSQRRAEGYLKALKKHGIEEPLICTLKNDFTETGLIDLFKNKRPTAVFLAYCASWGYVRNMLKRNDIAIPDNFPVLIYSDSVEPDMDAPFTGIAQPLEEIGYEAARSLMDAIEGTSSGKMKTNIRSSLTLGRGR